MAKRIIFYACYADTTTNVAGNTRVFSLGQIAADGTNPQLKSVEVDLAMSTAEAAKGSVDWNEVIVDADDEGSDSTFYGGKPQDALAGQIYLTEKFVDENEIPKFPSVYLQRPYEFQAILKVPNDPKERKRYYGFHARVVEVKILDGHRRALVLIYDAGKSLEEQPTPKVTMWLDLDDAREVDKAATTITETVGSEGALFLEGSKATESTLARPYDKKPASEVE